MTKRILRRIFVVIVAACTWPLFLIGVVWHIGKNWLEFGIEIANLAEDEWIGHK